MSCSAARASSAASALIIGTVVGMFIPTVLQNGFIVTNVEPFWQEVAIGFILIAAVYIDQLKRRDQPMADVEARLRTSSQPGSREKASPQSVLKPRVTVMARPSPPQPARSSRLAASARRRPTPAPPSTGCHRHLGVRPLHRRASPVSARQPPDGAGSGKKIVYVPGLTGVPFYSTVVLRREAAAAKRWRDLLDAGRTGSGASTSRRRSSTRSSPRSPTRS